MGKHDISFETDFRYEIKEFEFIKMLTHIISGRVERVFYCDEIDSDLLFSIMRKGYYFMLKPSVIMGEPVILIDPVKVHKEV